MEAFAKEKAMEDLLAEKNKLKPVRPAFAQKRNVPTVSDFKQIPLEVLNFMHGIGPTCENILSN